MADTACLTHAGSRQDHLWSHVKVDLFTVIAGNRQFQSGKTNRIDSFIYQFSGFIIKAFFYIFTKNVRSFHCKWTVYIHLKIRIYRNQSLLFDLPYKIKHLLCPSYSKTRHYYIAAPFEGILDDLCQLANIIRLFTIVKPVSVCRLHHNIIRCLGISRILQNWLVGVSKIARKYDGPFLSIFPCKNFYGRRPKQMANICKTHRHFITYMYSGIIRTWYKQSHCSQCIFHGIQRFIHLAAGSLCLAVSPFCLKLLDMCTVPQHNLAEIRCSLCCIHRSSESPGIQHR